MGSYRQKIVRLASLVVIGLFMSGCGQPKTPTAKIQTELGATIGSMTEVFAVQYIPVEGYGLVGGLRGTGSGECPTNIREYLKQYILTQLPERKLDPEKLISSRNTAVVRVHALMPPAFTESRSFDVKAEALPGTQTTSLEDGWLYGADLKEAGRFGLATRVLATVKGPVFVDTIDGVGGDKRAGYILGGGRVRGRYNMTLALRQPDFVAARRISDVLNARFGALTAKASSQSVIELSIPAEYGQQDERFISVVKAMYLSETPEATEKRIDALVEELASSADKQASESALEAIGNRCVKKLAGLLDSANEEVRLRAARCMVNLRSDRGLETLRTIAADSGSAYRMEALEAITTGANRNYAAGIARRLLRDDDFDVRLAAYEQLRRLDDVSVSRSRIGGGFYLEQITLPRQKDVFVSRSGQPRIVLFGAPIYCRENIFLQSADGEITIDAPAGQKYVSIIRKLAKRPGIPPIQLKSSFELSDVIRALCEAPVVKEGSQVRAGLNVSYSETAAILKQMCEQGAVAAEFRAGPLPKID
ncbi:MAG TPA: flagellar basal body P-ring protein FlgI [Sedimentisphaerales bacterium]|nr:flagellar basal body P-ring protein FlgI [Sedimentisphaerales bacterium]